MANYHCSNCGLNFSLPQNIVSPRCPSCGQPCQPQQYNAGPYNQGGAGYNQPNYAYGNPQQEPGVFDYGPSGKSRGVAGLLAIFFGGLGVHYFYLNKATGGIICILLTLITCGLWSVFALVQGIIMLTMKQADFENKYVNTTATFPLL